MPELYSYQKVSFDIKITWLVCDSSVLFEEVSPWHLEDVYEVLIFCYLFPQRVDHHNSGSINLGTEEDPVKTVDTLIQMKYWIYLSN